MTGASPKDPSDMKALLSWLFRIQRAEDKSEEWMASIKKSSPPLSETTKPDDKSKK
jgi:hypothetical protein